MPQLHSPYDTAYFTLATLGISVIRAPQGDASGPDPPRAREQMAFAVTASGSSHPTRTAA